MPEQRSNTDLMQGRQVTRVFASVLMVLIGCVVTAAHPINAQEVRQDTTVQRDTIQDSLRRDTSRAPVRDTVREGVQDTVRDTLPPPPRDTVIPVLDTTRRDSVRAARRDTAKRDTARVRTDTLQARIGRDEPPPTLEIGESYTYTRDELYASGSITLLDLLSRLPGITALQSGWIPSAQVAAYNGDLTRIRVFYDGIELDNLEPRNGAVLDLKSIQLWTLERLSITRGANEVRIDIRSWEYNKTRPYTRVDVLTGDLNTNLYRAFYGKRFFNGAALQVAAEQYGVTDSRFGGGGDQLSLFARYGIAKKVWSVDATVLRTRSVRTVTERFNNNGQFLPNYQATNTIAYIRAAVGKEGEGPFAQIVAASLGLKEASSHFTTSSAAQYGFPPDTVDSTASLSQIVATAGFDKWGGRIRVFERFRTRSGIRNHSFGGTFDFTRKLLGVSILAEHDGYYGYDRFEAGARFVPFNRVAVSGYVGQRSSKENQNGQVDSRSARVEAGVRVYGDAWLSGGVITRDTAILMPPIVFDSAFQVKPVGQTTGVIFSLRGPLRYGFSVDANAVTWNNRNAYTPKYQARAELKFATQWLSKFPSGNFGFQIAPYVEYRSRVAFPTTTGDREAAASRIYSILAEIRILRGVITYQRRNLALSIYEQVPGYIMPRTMNLYGVRWYFFD